MQNKRKDGKANMVSLANLKKDELRPVTVNDFYLAIGKF